MISNAPSTRPGITLVRPDGYIAYSTDHSGAVALEPVRTLLQKQVSPPERTRTAT